MKSFLTVLIGIVIGALITFCYFFFKRVEQKVVAADTSAKSAESVYLEISNKSNKPIRRLSIQSAKRKNIAEFTNLRYDDKIYKNYQLMRGEGISKLFIEFENGKKMYSADSYVERGYTLVQTIYNDSVQTDYK